MIQVTFVTKDRKTYEPVVLGTASMPELPSKNEYVVLDGLRYVVSHREWKINTVERRGERAENIAATVHLMQATE